MYEYIRGQGWVATNNPVFQLACGTMVMAIARQPELGEFFDWFYSYPGEDNNTEMLTDGEINLAQAPEYYRQFKLNDGDLSIHKNPDYWRLHDPDHRFITFVKV